MLVEKIEILTDKDGNDRLDEVKLVDESPSKGKRTIFLETYGCQMNVADSEVVASVLKNEGFGFTNNPDEADVVLINTCAIREKAEQKIRRRLVNFQKRKKRDDSFQVGILGCMAERLREKLLEEEKVVDLVVGPDAYRDLPRLIESVGDTGQSAVNVQLSKEETYADISPVRYDTNGISSFVSIMRGCDNMCAFCVVPFTRGRERSRPLDSILDECKTLVDQNYKEITVLGQNVNSYRYEKDGASVSFAELLYQISMISPELRVRYSTSHPKDCSEELLHVHKERHNVCNYIHLPVQHGDTEMLKRMRRTYSREQYLDLIDMARKICPGIALSTDVIAGFCGETEEEHQATLSLMEEVRFEFAYMFMYSERPGTYAHRKFEDDVPEEVKGRRLTEIIDLQHEIALELHKTTIGSIQTVLVEGRAKKSAEQLTGRADSNQKVVFPREHYQKGDLVNVLIEECSSATLIGKPVGKTTLVESHNVVA